MPEQPTNTQAQVSRAPVTLADLTGHLLWPRLLRAPKLALAPARVGLCAAMIAAVFGLDHLWRAVFKGPAPGPVAVLVKDLSAGWMLALEHLIAADVVRAGQALTGAFLTTPIDFLTGVPGDAGPWRGVAATLVLLPIVLVISTVAAGAVCRSAAREFAQGVVEPWTRSLGFGLARWRSLLGATLGPLLLVWVLIAALALGSLIFLKWPVLNVIGALLFPVFIIAALAAALIAAAYTLGQGLLWAAVACDDADAFDAVQRAYAYVFGRPLRLVIYQAVSLGLSLIALVALGAVVAFAGSMLGHATGLPLEDIASGVRSNADWSTRAAHWLVGVWLALLQLGVAAYAVSLYLTSQTIIYLLVRQLNDGADWSEVG